MAKRNSGTIQEPSSPKVTCIGQVRASHSAGKSTVSRRRQSCWLLEKTKALLISGEKSSRLPKIGFSRWGLFFGSGYCKKGAETEDSCTAYSNQKSEKTTNIIDDDFNDTKNGVILTRCGSDPYKSSSLGGLFWSSSLIEGGSENEAELRKQSWENSRNEEKDNSMKMEDLLVNKFQELKGNAGGVVHPLLLTRCKSEPAARR
ncbi:hypothetical protein CASFOL_009294 [Castilleja foliolosa]|uniref:Uncharacterized protein n=1 Tax=Castilleja foliolosa TaxID=1961234 RepID=A0ABD3E0X1_9LAMI